MWCVAELSSEFVERMEDLLRLYARKLDPAEPVICLDERPVVLREDARRAIPMKPGVLKRRDYEYVRCGTANIFCIIEPQPGRRLTFATADRKRRAYVWALKKIAARYKHARRIHLIQDNLNTDISKFPGLGDLPIIGPLFRSSRFQRQETELVIIVTPYVVRPVPEGPSLKLPTDGMQPASDIERVVLDRLVKPSTGIADPASLGGARLRGDAGFIFE